MKFDIVHAFCDICHKEIKFGESVTPIGDKTYCSSCWIRKTSSNKPFPHLSKNARLLLLKRLIPKIADIDPYSFTFTIDNHLNEYGHRTRAQTTDISCRLKDGRYMEIHIE
jgi:hypothetical protein